jgi:uncharacterized protein (TIGR04222 family)
MDPNPLNWPAAPFLALYVGLAAVVFSAGFAWRADLGSRAERRARLNALEWAYLAGGPSRVGDVSLLCLVSRGGAAIDAKSSQITIEDRTPLAALGDEASDLPIGASMSRKAFQSELQPLVRHIEARLQKVGYAPTDGEVDSFRLTVLPVVAVLLAFGVAKAMVGAGRGHPVGILVILLFAVAALGFVLAKRPWSTRAGAAALSAHRDENARSARAPLDAELLLAVALSGAVVLSGTEFAPVYALSRSSDGGGDGGGGGCGGGGGGGCGGCS